MAAGCAGGESAPPREPVVRPAAPSAARPTDQLASLEQRLRDTKATIGVFTKISLKNQVDDLLTQFRAFHQEGAGVLTELREKYSLLLLKVLALLQAGDPVLARAIAASREAIWSLLEDPAKFATL